MKSHRVTGGGGVQLHVVETGNPSGRAILLIHGVSGCHLTWIRQLDSDLAHEFRLVAMDMRGHGLSERPADGYGQSKLWADDVQAVIESLALDRPILCGWSYGPLVILDYIRRYGSDRIGGINMVGGISKLGSEAALGAITPEFLALAPGLFSTDPAESNGAISSLLRLCFANPPTGADWDLMMDYSTSVPGSVRQALFARAFDNDDLLPAIEVPALISHGARDAVVKRSVIDEQWSALPRAEVDIVPNTGHAPFWDDAARYNQRLRAFAERVWGAGARRAEPIAHR